MFQSIGSKIKFFISLFKKTLHQFNNQAAYEIKKVATCQKTNQHMIEVKVTGKSQSILCLAEEVAVDNNFIMGFSPSDIRTITYLATSDRYETILREEKIKKSFEVVRSPNRNTNKKVRLKHKETNEYVVISLSDFADQDLIDKLTSLDAYYLGYLAGQEQILKDTFRLKLISRSSQD